MAQVNLRDFGFSNIYQEDYESIKPLPAGRSVNKMAEKEKDREEKGESNKPIQVYRAGVVSVSIFENTNQDKEGKDFTTKSFAVQRAYTKDEGKTWEHTNSFKLNDVPKLISMLQKAYEEQVRTSQEE